MMQNAKPQGRKLNRMAVKEEHQRKTQPNFEARQRQEERKEAHERWKKELEVRVVAGWLGWRAVGGVGCLSICVCICGWVVSCRGLVASF